MAEPLPGVAVTPVGAGAGGILSIVIAVTEPSICSGNEADWAEETGVDCCEGR